MAGLNEQFEMIDLSTFENLEVRDSGTCTQVKVMLLSPNSVPDIVDIHPTRTGNENSGVSTAITDAEQAPVPPMAATAPTAYPDYSTYAAPAEYVQPQPQTVVSPQAAPAPGQPQTKQSETQKTAG